MTLYEVSAEAQEDLFGSWSHIAEDSVELANRIDSEFHALFASLGRMPGQGRLPGDISTRCEAHAHHGSASRKRNVSEF
jgi:plasmid stabilization system protein ParE